MPGERVVPYFLLVDDDSNLRSTVREVIKLTAPDAEVVEASTAAEALRACSQNPFFSRIFIDGLEGKLDGPSFAKTLLEDPSYEQDRDAIVALTASLEKSSLFQEMGIPVVMKPFDISELITHIDRLDSPNYLAA